MIFFCLVRVACQTVSVVYFPTTEVATCSPRLPIFINFLKDTASFRHGSTALKKNRRIYRGTCCRTRNCYEHGWFKIKCTNTLVSKKSYLCSKHFEEECFIKPLGGQRIRLKPGSVPTKFVFTGKERKERGLVVEGKPFKDRAKTMIYTNTHKRLRTKTIY